MTKIVRGKKRYDPKWSHAAIFTDYDQIFSGTEQDLQIVPLLRHQAEALRQIVDYFRWQTRWYSDSGATIDTALLTDFADDIMDRLTQDWVCDVEQPEEPSCLQIGPFHPALDYFPNHPTQSPDYEGEYTNPIWSTGAGYIGGTENDSMINPLAYLGQSLEDIINGGLLPRITLRFEGAGEIDIGFLSQIQGGAVWLYPDGNFFAGDMVNLQHVDIFELISSITIADLFEFFFQGDYSTYEVVHSITFDTPGPHYLDMLFIPSGEPTPPFVGIGGGLRYIQLCGDITVSEDEVTAYTLEPFGDGTIILKADGIQVSTVDLKTLLDDDYVNTEGDTMTGPLKVYTNVPLLMEFGRTTTKYFSMLATSHIYWLMEAARQWGLIHNAQGDQFGVGVRGFSFKRAPSDLPYVQTAADSWLQIDVPAGENAIVDFRHSSSAQWRWQRLAKDVAMIHNSGWIIASNYLFMRARTSTDAWRDQGYFATGWVDSVDATHKGSLEARVASYGGSQVLWRGEADEAGEKLAFRDSTPILKPSVDNDSVGGAVLQMALYGAQYGLWDLPIAGIFEGGQADPPETVFGKCNAAWFIAQAIAALVSDLIDNLQTLSPNEVLTGLLDGYDLYISQTYQLVSYIELQGAEWAGIQSDVSSGIPDLAQALYDGEFDIDAVADFIAGFAGYGTATADTLLYALAALLPGQWQQWIAIGSVTDSGQLCGELPTCEEIASQNFRFGMGAWVIEQGTQVVYSGVQSQSDGSNIYARVHCESDDCPYDQITVEWWAQNAVNDELQIQRGVRNELGVMVWGGVQPVGPSGPVPGEQFNTIALSGGGGWDGVRISTQAASAGTGYQNTIRSVLLEEV